MWAAAASHTTRPQAMNVIREINRINEKEAALGIDISASWHVKYRDSAYIYVGGLDYELTEGDIIAVFSQYARAPPDIRATGFVRVVPWLGAGDRWVTGAHAVRWMVCMCVCACAW